jgi:hypothetical protein
MSKAPTRKQLKQLKQAARSHAAQESVANPGPALAEVIQIPQPADRRPWWWLLAILLLTLIVYGNCLEGPFLFDDDLMKTTVNAPSFARSLSVLWQADQRIIPDWTFALCKSMQGDTTWSYHAVNVLIHCANGIFLYLIVRSTLSGQRLQARYGDAAPALALICAGLYLVHPLNTESVSYITQRMQSLMSLFQLASLWAVIRASTSPFPGRWQIIAVMAFICSIDSKPHSVAMPVLVLLYERIFLADSWTALLRRSGTMYAGFAWVLAVNIGLMVTHFGDMDIGTVHKPSPSTADKSMTIADYLISELAVVCRYIQLSVVPIHQSLDYMWPVDTDVRDIWPFALILMLCAGLTLYALAVTPAVGFLAVWFWLNLLPSSSLVPRPDLCVEHRMYVPLQAIIVLAVLCGHSLYQRAAALNPARWQRRVLVRMPIIAAVCVGCALSWLTIERNRLYGSVFDMWSDVASGNVLNFRAQQWLANFHYRRMNYDEAAVHYSLAIHAYPHFYDAWNGLGQSYWLLGRSDQAIAVFQESIPLLDKTAASKEYDNIAVVMFKMNRLEQAQQNFQLAIQTNPGNYSARFNLGLLLKGNHQDQEALALFKSVLVIKPDHEGAMRNVTLMEERIKRPE